MGRFVGLVQLKIPATLAAPPLSTELLNACPKLMGEAVGQLLMTGVPLAIMKVLVWWTTPTVLEAVINAMLVPAVVGLPKISPLVLRVSPVGGLEALKVMGTEPLAVSWLLNTTPTVPRQRLVEVITGAIAGFLTRMEMLVVLDE